MLTNLLLKVEASSIGDAALYAFLGFAITFAGIALLILIVWLVGLLMPKVEVGLAKSQEKKEAKKAKKAEKLAKSDSDKVEATDNVVEDVEVCDEETVAVITAAIMAYYQKNSPKCEFTIKRIKRI